MSEKIDRFMAYIAPRVLLGVLLWIYAFFGYAAWQSAQWKGIGIFGGILFLGVCFLYTLRGPVDD